MEENKNFNFKQIPGEVLENNVIKSEGKPLISIITAYYNCKKYINMLFNITK